MLKNLLRERRKRGHINEKRINKSFYYLNFIKITNYQKHSKTKQNEKNRTERKKKHKTKKIVF